MNGRVSRSLRRVGQVDRKLDGKRKYYHYNEEKRRKNQKADSSDPIIADAKRQTYKAIKKVFQALTGNHFGKPVKLSVGQKLSYVRGLMSDAAKDS